MTTRRKSGVPHEWVCRGTKTKTDSTEIFTKQRWRCRCCGIDAQMIVTMARWEQGRSEPTTRWRYRMGKGLEWTYGTPESDGIGCDAPTPVTPKDGSR